MLHIQSITVITPLQSIQPIQKIKRFACQNVHPKLSISKKWPCLYALFPAISNTLSNILSKDLCKQCSYQILVSEMTNVLQNCHLHSNEERKEKKVGFGRRTVMCKHCSCCKKAATLNSEEIKPVHYWDMFVKRHQLVNQSVKKKSAKCFYSNYQVQGISEDINQYYQAIIRLVFRMIF